MKQFLLISCLSLLLLSCQNKPKVIQANDQNNSTVDFTPTVPIQTPTSSSFQDQVHRVKVIEVLAADPYNYLNVTEGTDSYWIAIRKQEVSVGLEYYFANGLLKTGFESKTHNRTFEKLYLVSKLVPLNHSNATSNQLSIPTEKKSNSTKATQTNEVASGVISIKTLIKNPESYEGQHITISGRITKINPEIMNRNWIHLKDGSADDYDLVVTSSEMFKVGETVTINAHVVLNKDFGAGYTYPLILENAKSTH